MYKNDGGQGSMSSYQRIVNELNVDFNKPKKDQCPLCLSFREGDEATQEDLRDKFNSHQCEKKASRQEKQRAKERAENNPKFVAAVFDMQQVLYLPKLNRSEVFYKR